ncbi:MAG: hypothetical protein HY700_05015 [Gemmatimonadetes bacterium]|nr:hypothetical protein [Gemmatimonadota bacterium]
MTVTPRPAADGRLASDVLPFLASSRFKTIEGAMRLECNAPGESPFSVNGVGQGSYLGQFEVTLGICSYPGGWKDGHAIFVAENGDALQIQYVGRPLPPNAVSAFQSTWWVVRGTGRFTGLIGGGRVLGTVDLRTGAGSAIWEGKLTTSPSAGSSSGVSPEPPRTPQTPGRKSAV